MWFVDGHDQLAEAADSQEETPCGFKSRPGHRCSRRDAKLWLLRYLRRAECSARWRACQRDAALALSCVACRTLWMPIRAERSIRRVGSDVLDVL